MSSIRCSATRAHVGGVGVDGDPVDDVAVDEVLEHPAQVRRRRCGTSSSTGRSSGSSDTTVLSGCLGGQPLHEVDLGADARCVEPGGAASTGPDDEVGRADLVGELRTRSCAHSGWTTTMPSGCSARNAATCSGRKRWCTEQWPFHSRNVASLHVGSVRPPSSRRGFHTRMSSCVVAHGQAGVAAEVLVGEEQHLRRPRRLEAPTRAPARALDDVHTAPPWRPTNAFSAAEEFM